MTEIDRLAELGVPPQVAKKLLELIQAGGTPAAAQADSDAATIAALRDDFNELLGKMRAAGFVSA